MKMIKSFGDINFRLLVKALTVAIMVPCLMNGQYSAFILTVCVFALGQMVEYTSFIQETYNKWTVLSYGIGCILAIIVTVLCFLHLSNLAYTSDSTGVIFTENITNESNAGEEFISELEDKDKTNEAVLCTASPSRQLVVTVRTALFISVYYVFLDLCEWVISLGNGLVKRNRYMLKHEKTSKRKKEEKKRI